MTSVVPLFFLNLIMNMKAKYGKEDIYIKYVSSDKKYALVSKEKVGKRKVFKLDFTQISGLNKRDLNKLEKLYEWKDS
jgi:hypothetical protein